MGPYEYVIVYTAWLGITALITLITTFIVFYFLSKKKFKYEIIGMFFTYSKYSVFNIYNIFNKYLIISYLKSKKGIKENDSIC